MEGLLLLREVVGSEQRPLGWWVEPQGVERPPMPSQRESKRERLKVTQLRTPDEI